MGDSSLPASSTTSIFAKAPTTIRQQLIIAVWFMLLELLLPPTAIAETSEENTSTRPSWISYLLIDTDFDGIRNTLDAFPTDRNETTDTDGDGIGNNADLDDDGDGVQDLADAFPLDAQEQADSDSDGVGDNADPTPYGDTFNLWISPAHHIVANMTLEQKVGQMIQTEIGSITLQEITDFGIGSVLNGGGSHPGGNRAAPVSDWLAYARDLREASIKTSSNSIGIPIIWGTDAVHGHNNVRGATIFPHNIGLGAINDPDLIRQIAVATAAEVGATGIDWTFAPTVAQAKDYRWGRTYESYSDDPALVRDYAIAMVEGIESQGIAATAKHFIGDGGTARGTDQGDTNMSLDQLLDEHGSGFLGAFEADVDTVMATFNSWNGAKVHGSQTLLEGVLRDQLAFRGMVISDWNGIGQVASCSDTSCAQAINAGIDMVMVPYAWRDFRTTLIDQVNRGEVSQSRIDEAVTRIIELKQKLGMIQQSFDPARQPAAVVGSTEHRAIAREAVRRSQVLLKNNGSALPLTSDMRVLLVGAAADSVPFQSGGWSVTWQGTDTTNSDFPGSTSIKQALETVLAAGGGNLEYSVSGNHQSLPDAVIVVVSESPYAEGQGDRSNLDWSGGGAEHLSGVQALREQGIPVITVFMSGRPMFVNPELNLSDAFIAAWLPGTEAGGIADVLFATDGNDFEGRLPFSWPGAAVNHLNADLPVAAHLFTKGYGLSYSKSATLPVLTEDPLNPESGIVEATSTGGGGDTSGPAEAPFWVLRDGAVEPVFDRGISAFDAPSYDVCSNDNGLACDSISWEWVDDDQRGSVLEIRHESPFDYAAVFFETFTPQDLSSYAQGDLVFELKHLTGPDDYRVKLDCVYPCSSEHLDLTTQPTSQWQTIRVPLSAFTNSGLDITRVNTGLVIWARDHNGTQFRIDDVRFEP